jgi:nucleoside-diphosphate-sugar epimerase
VFNRIHVDDIAGAIEAAMSAGRDIGDIVNLTDDLPAPASDVIAYAAELIGVAPPPEIMFDEADLSAMARSFYADNKRVSNEQMKSILGYQLQHPTFREGLTAIWNDRPTPTQS